jgi:hypothetical protein
VPQAPPRLPHTTEDYTVDGGDHGADNGAGEQPEPVDGEAAETEATTEPPPEDRAE